MSGGHYPYPGYNPNAPYQPYHYGQVQQGYNYNYQPQQGYPAPHYPEQHGYYYGEQAYPNTGGYPPQQPSYPAYPSNYDAPQVSHHYELAGRAPIVSYNYEQAGHAPQGYTGGSYSPSYNPSTNTVPTGPTSTPPATTTATATAASVAAAAPATHHPALPSGPKAHPSLPSGPMVRPGSGSNIAAATNLHSSSGSNTPPEGMTPSSSGSSINKINGTPSGSMTPSGSGSNISSSGYRPSNGSSTPPGGMTPSSSGSSINKVGGTPTGSMTPSSSGSNIAAPATISTKDKKTKIFGRIIRSDSQDTDQKAKALERRIRGRCQRQQSHLVLVVEDKDKVIRDAFNKFDLDKDSFLNNTELKLALASWGIVFETSDVEAFASRFTTRKPANVNLEEFKKMSQFILNVREKFTKHDVDHSDTINLYGNTTLFQLDYHLIIYYTSREIVPLLAEFGFKFDATVTKSLFEVAGDNQGELEFQDFTTLLLYLYGVANKFKEGDTDMSNSLSASEIHAVLRSLGVYLTVTEVEVALKRSGKKELDFAGLMALLSDVRQNIDLIRQQAQMLNIASVRNLTPAAKLSSRRSMVIPSQHLLQRQVTKAQIQEAAAKNGEAAQIIASLKGTGRKWEDPNFPASEASLFPLTPEHNSRVACWRRISEISPKAQLFVDGMNEGDVIQGALGDCWFLSAVAVLTHSGTFMINNIFVGQYPEYGFYQVSFYKDDKWQLVTVDDRIPCGKSGSPVFASCRDPNEFWLPILEKAYAKLHGSYGAIEAGSMSDAMVDLTAEVSETIDIVETDEFWNQLLSYAKGGFLMGCGSIPSRNKGVYEEETPLGILTSHAYGIMECVEIQGHRLIRLRNPWGRYEWKGRWSDGAKEWTPELQKALNFNFDDDGTFFMCFGDFCKHFVRLYVLHLVTDKLGTKIFKRSYQSEWTAETSGGCTTSPMWVKNPQFRLVIEGNDPSDVFISIRQADKRGTKKPDEKFPSIGFFVMKDKNLDDYRKTSYSSSQEIVHYSTYCSAREVSSRVKLEPNTKYVIVPSHYKPGGVGPFYLSIYTSVKYSFSPLVKDRPSISITGEWCRAAGTANGCTNYAFWCDNPQYLLSVRTPGKFYITLAQLNTTEPQYVGFEIMKANDSKRRILDKADRIYDGNYVNSATVCGEVELDVGNYIVIASTFYPNLEGKFVLRVETEAQAALTEINDSTDWIKSKIDGAWGPGKQGGCRNHPTWRENPKFKFTVSKPTTITALVGLTGELGAKAPVVHGVYILNDKDEVVNSRLTRFSNARSMSVTMMLEPGTYKIMPCTFDKGISGTFTLKTYSDQPISALVASQ